MEKVEMFNVDINFESEENADIFENHMKSCAKFNILRSGNIVRLQWFNIGDFNDVSDQIINIRKSF